MGRALGEGAAPSQARQGLTAPEDPPRLRAVIRQAEALPRPPEPTPYAVKPMTPAPARSADTALDASVRVAAQPLCHPAGTRRMGVERVPIPPRRSPAPGSGTG